MIFGVRAVIEAIQAGKEIDKVLVKKDIQSDLSKELFAVLKNNIHPGTACSGGTHSTGLPRRITRESLPLFSAHHLSADRRHRSIPVRTGKEPVWIMLDGVTDVRNFGAIARTCECAGVDAIIIPSKNSVSVNADAIKTSAGALHTLPVCRENNLTNTIKFLKESGFKIVLTERKETMITPKPIIRDDLHHYGS